MDVASYDEDGARALEAEFAGVRSGGPAVYADEARIALAQLHLQQDSAAAAVAMAWQSTSEAMSPP